jgi:hypothetical protein
VIKIGQSRPGICGGAKFHQGAFPGIRLSRYPGNTLLNFNWFKKPRGATAMALKYSGE